jgi:hypothetical protein
MGQMRAEPVLPVLGLWVTASDTGVTKIQQGVRELRVRVKAKIKVNGGSRISHLRLRL